MARGLTVKVLTLYASKLVFIYIYLYIHRQNKSGIDPQDSELSVHFLSIFWFIRRLETFPASLYLDRICFA